MYLYSVVNESESKSISIVPESDIKSKSCAVTCVYYLTAFAEGSVVSVPAVDDKSVSKTPDFRLSTSKLDIVLLSASIVLFVRVSVELFVGNSSTLSFKSSMCCCSGDIRTTEPEACDNPDVAAEPVKYLLFMLSNVSVLVPEFIDVTSTTSLFVALSGFNTK